MTDALVTSLQAAVVAMATAFPEVSVESHPGRFDLDELRRLSLRTPAVRLALLAIPPGRREKDGRIKVAAQWAAFVVAGDKAGVPRHLGALMMIDQLYRWLPYRRWGTAEPLNLETLDARNLYSAALDSQSACAIWAITWTQSITIEVPEHE